MPFSEVVWSLHAPLGARLVLHRHAQAGSAEVRPSKVFIQNRCFARSGVSSDYCNMIFIRERRRVGPREAGQRFRFPSFSSTLTLLNTILCSTILTVPEPCFSDPTITGPRLSTAVSLHDTVDQMWSTLRNPHCYSPVGFVTPRVDESGRDPYG